MKHDLHPNWTSTGSPNEKPDEGGMNPDIQEESFTPADFRDAAPAASSASSHRIPVRTGTSHIPVIVFSLFLGVSGISFMGFVFLQGVSFLQANITQGITPDHTITLDSKGFKDLTVKVDDLIEFKNMLQTVEQYRSEEPNPASGAPLIATESIPPSGSTRVKVPKEAAGKEIMLISGFDPSRRGKLLVEASNDEESSDDVPVDTEEEPEEGDLGIDVPLPTITSTPTPSAQTQASSSSSAAVATTQNTQPTTVTPIPKPQQAVVPPQAPPPAPTQPIQTVNVGMAAATSANNSLWPTSLKVNRYTIGSGLVPDLSRMVSIPLRGSKNAAPLSANSNGVHHAPATGPELWVLVALSLCVMPMYVIRRRVR